MKLELTNYMTPDNEMTFGDFIIRYEHKFLRNIYTTEQIEQSDNIKNLESFYEIFNPMKRNPDCFIIDVGTNNLTSNWDPETIESNIVEVTIYSKADIKY